MLFTFENGKMAKVALKNYETKTNRKKLVGAYSNKSPIRDIKFLAEDADIAVVTDTGRLICLDTALVPLKSTKSTQGVQVIKQPKAGAKPAKVALAADCGIEDIEAYRVRTIPAAAKSPKNENVQLSLL